MVGSFTTVWSRPPSSKHIYPVAVAERWCSTHAIQGRLGAFLLDSVQLRVGMLTEILDPGAPYTWVVFRSLSLSDGRSLIGVEGSGV